MRKDCKRCGGTGRIDTYSHVAYGICFACGGNSEATAPKIKRLNYADAYARYGELVDELVALGRLEAKTRRTEIAADALDRLRTGVTTDPAKLKAAADKARRTLRLEGAPLARLVELTR